MEYILSWLVAKTAVLRLTASEDIAGQTLPAEEAANGG